LEEVAAGAIVVDLTRIAGESGLRPASELVLLGKALLNLDEVARTLDPAFDPNRAIREEAGVILRNKVVGAASPANLLSVALEAKEFAEKLPSRVNKVMDALAEGELRLHVDGIDEKQFLRGMQKIANRVTMGLLLAAMIVGAAMLVRVPTPTRLFGYPALAMACFLAAGLGALILVISIIVSDRD
jgi:ubiquinone biosynthesis protein